MEGLNSKNVNIEVADLLNITKRILKLFEFQNLFNILINYLFFVLSEKLDNS